MNKKTINSIGERIRKIREELGYTQKKLASEAQVTPAAISQIESSDRSPSVPVLCRLAQALKVSASYILGNSDAAELQDLLEDQDVRAFYSDFKDLDSIDKEYIKKQIKFLTTLAKKI